MFDIFINTQDVREVVQHHAVSVLIGRIESVDRLADSLEAREEVKSISSLLQSTEKRILKESLEALRLEQRKLAQAESIMAYTNEST